MPPIPYENLGALERAIDERDFLLGAIQAPVAIPPAAKHDMMGFRRNFQGQTPACGPHAASHLKQLLDDNGTAPPHYTPDFTWIELKDPNSGVYDNHPLEDGTDMRSLLASMRKKGMDDFDPLGNDVTLSLAQYSDPSRVTPDMIADAVKKLIQSYAFGNTDYDSLCQHYYQNGGVIILGKVDEGFWGTTEVTLKNPKWGHFFTMFGYDEPGIWIVDSAEPDPTKAFKHIAKEFIQPQFIVESGTVVNIPLSVHLALRSGFIEIAQQILKDMEAVLHLDQQLVPKVATPN